MYLDGAAGRRHRDSACSSSSTAAPGRDIAPAPSRRDAIPAGLGQRLLAATRPRPILRSGATLDGGAVTASLDARTGSPTHLTRANRRTHRRGMPVVGMPLRGPRMGSGVGDQPQLDATDERRMGQDAR